MKSTNNFKSSPDDISDIRMKLDNNPCGMCRSNGMPLCKGHGKSGGNSASNSVVHEDRASQKDFSAASDNPGLQSVFTSLKESPLWTSDYEEMIFNYHNPNSLISITADTGIGLIHLSGIPIESDSHEQAQHVLLNAIEQELNVFKEGSIPISINAQRSENELKIKIQDKTSYDAFMLRLMDKNLLVTQSIHLNSPKEVSDMQPVYEAGLNKSLFGNSTREMRQYLQELKQGSTRTDATHHNQQEVEERNTFGFS